MPYFSNILTRRVINNFFTAHRHRARHKSILNTQMYVNMEQALFTSSSNGYHVKLASTVEEATKLTEVGCEYVAEMESKKIFKKRK